MVNTTDVKSADEGRCVCIEAASTSHNNNNLQRPQRKPHGIHALSDQIVIDSITHLFTDHHYSLAHLEIGVVLDPGYERISVTPSVELEIRSTRSG